MKKLTLYNFLEGAQMQAFTTEKLLIGKEDTHLQVCIVMRRLMNEQQQLGCRFAH